MSAVAYRVSAQYVPQGRLPLRVNFVWTFLGNAVNAAGQFGALMVLARLGSSETVGQYALGLAIATPITALAMLQLQAVLVTDARDEYAFADYFGLRLVLTTLGLVVVAACAVLGRYHPDTAWIVFWVGAAKAVDSVNDIVRALFQRHERMDVSGISLMIKGPAALGALAAVMWWQKRAVEGAAAMAVVWLLAFLLYDMPRAKRLLRLKSMSTGAVCRFRPQFDPAAMARLAWLALPLGVVMFLIALQAAIPRYALQWTTGESSLGYFAAVVAPMTVGTMVSGALGQSASPRLACYFVEDLAAFRRLLRKLVGMGAVLGALLVLGAAALGRPVLWLLYGADYAEYSREFLVVSLAFGIQLVSTFYGFGLTAARSFRSQVLLTGLSCLVTAVAAAVAVPRWGVMGAAITTLATSVTALLVYVVALHRRLRQQAGGAARCRAFGASDWLAAPGGAAPKRERELTG